MGSEGIFLKVGDKLSLLQQEPYDSETFLQQALAEHPEVIAGPTTEGDRESRLLLVRREMGVPSSPQSGSTFSLDHLFLDDEGVPVLVEVKRASDTRIRREVVGQLLDYAANAVVYWPLTALRDALSARASQAAKTVEELFNEFRPDLDPDQFWGKVEANLKLGRIRMIFAADSLPPELVRIIEFLNEQMSPAEVLGVELRQFRSADHTAYVPRVVGQTTAAAQSKSSGSGVTWSRDNFLEAAQSRCDPAEQAVVRRLLSHVDDHGVRLSWGRGLTPGVGGWYDIDGRPTGLWVLNLNTESPTTKPYLVFYYADVVGRVGAERVERSAEKLRNIPGMHSKIDAARASNWAKYPSVYLSDAAQHPERIQAIFDAIETLVEMPKPPGSIPAPSG